MKKDKDPRLKNFSAKRELLKKFIEAFDIDPKKIKIIDLSKKNPNT